MAAAFMVGESVLNVQLTFFPEGKGDDLSGGDWWLQVWFLVLFGGLYLYAASSLTVTRAHVVVRNPFRHVDIPLGQVLTAVPGSHLRIKTAHRDFVAVGVEAANFQIGSGDFGTQADIARLITKAAAKAIVAGEADEAAPARYRFTWPDPLFLTFGVIHVVATAVLILHNGPVRLSALVTG